MLRGLEVWIYPSFGIKYLIYGYRSQPYNELFYPSFRQFTIEFAMKKLKMSHERNA